MYIIIDGMPGTGKTALSKRLASMTGAAYMKSVLSNTNFGVKLRDLRVSNFKEKYELLIMSDLLLDELRVGKLLQSRSIIRDKAFTASLGHLAAHGFENRETEITDIIQLGYKQLQEFSVLPDIAVHLKMNEERIKLHYAQKDDASDIDNYLISNMELYKKQDDAMKDAFGSRLIEL